MFQKIKVIVNPASGKDRPIIQVLNRVFQELGIAWDLCLTKQDEDVQSFIDTALQEQVDAVAVYGGDGTIMDAVGGLVNSDIPVLLLRGGTANVVASELSIPKDLEEACRLLAPDRHVLRQIDVGRINERYFLLRVSVGFEAEMVKQAEREMKDQIGTLAYAVGMFKAMVGMHSARYTLALDGDDITMDALTCIIANSGNMGLPGLTLARDIEVDDGKLDVILIRQPQWQDFFTAKNFVIDTRESDATFFHRKVQKVAVKVDPPQDVQCDGEIIQKDTFSIEVLPGAIKMIVLEQSGFSDQFNTQEDA